MNEVKKCAFEGDQIRESIANLALIEAQAMVVAFLASIFAIVLGWIPKGSFFPEHALILCASSMITAFAASLILSVIMIFVILCSRRFHINPDNVATPIAASLGDLTTLTLLALAASWLSETSKQSLSFAIIALFVSLSPIFAAIAWRNPLTKVVLLTGWSPVIFAMLISSAGGFILNLAVMRFNGLAIFQPVINGIGGNLVAVQASRLSTSLHKEAPGLGILPDHAPRNCPNPFAVICGVPGRAARVLLALVIPGHLIFTYMIHYLNAGHTAITPLFLIVYLSAALLQVAMLLYICAWMVHKMWSRGIDPDNSAIPYLTALGDLFGIALLAIAFQIVYLVTGKDSNIVK